jgi:transcriptional regulator NrdR family protein
MAKLVIKKDGSKMQFDIKKIRRSITRAASDAKLTPEEMNKVVNEVSDTVFQFCETRDKVSSNEIKDLILSELDQVAPKVSSEWRKFVNSTNKI